MIKYIRFSEVELMEERFEILDRYGCYEITNSMGIEEIIKVLIAVFGESILDYVEEYLPDLLSRNLEDVYFAILKRDGLELEENNFLQEMESRGYHIYIKI